ncbi:RidA family protein [Streptomyces sp. adm13(2018)]|uniref:RidA family protein n=1 Tax=Streptomyces sp. adm13(2018) TaxID=2479007 RepID=UPI0021C78B28|nr:RidA family protein [Streptomyces sp. adm13(2018)]
MDGPAARRRRRGPPAPGERPRRHDVQRGELVFIAGQYASDASGAPVPGDFAAQVELSLTNLRLALEGVGLGPEHVVRLGSYVVDHDMAKLEALGKGLHAHFGERLPAQTLSGVAALALPGMLFEIDAVAVRPAG